MNTHSIRSHGQERASYAHVVTTQRVHFIYEFSEP